MTGLREENPRSLVFGAGGGGGGAGETHTDGASGRHADDCDSHQKQGPT